MLDTSSLSAVLWKLLSHYKYDPTKEARGSGETPHIQKIQSTVLRLILVFRAFSSSLFAWFSFHFTVIISVRRSVDQLDGDTWNGSPHGKARVFSDCNSQAFPWRQPKRCLSPQKLHRVVVFQCLQHFPYSVESHQIEDHLLFPLSFFSIIMKTSWNQGVAVHYK